MRLFLSLLLLIEVAFVQCRLVVPQFNSVNTLESLRPQIKNFFAQLDKALPQLSGILSSFQIQSLKDQIIQVISSHLDQKLDIDAIKNLLRPVLQQFLETKSNSRFNIDAILQNIAESTVQSLPSIVLSILGKRDVDEPRFDINNVFSLGDKHQLDTLITQLKPLLSSDKLQQLYAQLMNTGVLAVVSQWNINSVAQAVQQIVTQFIPQISQSRLNIDWEKLGVQIVKSIICVFPGVLVGALDKRDARLNPQQLLSELSIEKLGQILQIIRSGDKTTAVLRLKKLLEKFFPGYEGRLNFDDMANNLINHVNNLLPTLSQSLLTSIVG